MTVTILCLASYFKGTRFLVAAKELGCQVILLTREKLRDEAWPMAAIDERFLLADLNEQAEIVHSVSYLARTRQIDAIVPLDDYDVMTAALLREHLRLPGVGQTVIRYFRDKLAMRTKAREAGIAVPAFTGVFNYGVLAEWMAQTPLPWVLKPRLEAGAMGIKKINHADEVWRWLERLGDEGSFFLLERFVPGDVYHVDALVWEGEVVFASAQKYGKPPIEVSHGGGVFMSSTLPAGSPESTAILRMNERIITAFGLEWGATHTEFIRGADGQYYFLETAARVGGASVDRLVEAATGLNPWAEWAKIETARVRGADYQVTPSKAGQAGLLACLARQRRPDLSGYSAPEVVWQMEKDYHAGLIVAGDDPGRIQALLHQYSHQFARDFLAYVPPLDKAPT